MQKLLQQINQLDYGIIGNPVEKSDIAKFQFELSQKNLPLLPSDFIEFLKNFNGFCAEGNCIWGINTLKHSFNDIFSENLHSHNPTPDNLLLLGATETSYIGYFKSSKQYSMIDKDSFMVLHNFKNFTDAVRYVLRIND